MLKRPAENTELTRPANERVRPSLSWRNAKQALHTRVAAFLGFAVLLTAVFIKPLFSLAAGAMQSQLESAVVNAMIPATNGIIAHNEKLRQPFATIVDQVC